MTLWYRRVNYIVKYLACQLCFGIRLERINLLQE